MSDPVLCVHFLWKKGPIRSFAPPARTKSRTTVAWSFPMPDCAGRASKSSGGNRFSRGAEVCGRIRSGKRSTLRVRKANPNQRQSRGPCHSAVPALRCRFCSPSTALPLSLRAVAPKPRPFLCMLILNEVTGQSAWTDRTSLLRVRVPLRTGCGPPGVSKDRRACFETYHFAQSSCSRCWPCRRD